MKPIPTAEEFLKQYQKGADTFCVTRGEAINKLVEFAELHVEAALKAASEKAQTECDEGGETGFVNEESILNAYPLSKIV